MQNNSILETNPPPGHEIKIFGRSLTVWILLALVGGLAVGLLIKWLALPQAVDSFLVDGVFKVGGEVFFASLKMLIVPVVFVSLVCGVGALDDVKSMGRIGGKTILLYVGTTALAITIALLVSLLTKPGRGFNLTSPAEFIPKTPPTLAETIIGFVPANPLQSMVDANMIQVIVLALLVGIGLSLAHASGQRILALFHDLSEVIMKLVNLVMLIAPIGVFCLLATVFARQGFDAIAPLSKYFLTVLFVLFLHVVVVYGGLLKFVAKLSPLTFFRKFQEVMVFAFSTSSSNAVLPATLEVTENQLGVKNSVASFTLPLGATVNMDGTSIMQGVATVFISQAYGVDIGLGGYITVILTATVASIGTAGVPGVGLITLAMVLEQVGLPVEGIGLIIGVDRLLDMTRTMVNVTGDAAVTCIVAKSENQFDEKVFNTLD
jgi:Na+/H+-dicarboxylate symporter